MDEIERFICRLVSDRQGVKLVELVTLVTVERPDLTNPTESINRLIWAGHLVEVEYILPTLNHTIKSFILPGGTIFRQSALVERRTYKREGP